MYCVGLGDCFLLTFPRSDGSECHVMIDCGVLKGSNSAKLKLAVQNIYETTGGKLDVLVGTHVHWDHVSGFKQARELFTQFKVKQVWLPWTETIGDVKAAKLQDERKTALAALQTAITHISGAGLTGEELGQKKKSVQAVLDFFGDAPSPARTVLPGGDGEAAAAVSAASEEITSSDSGGSHEAMDFLASFPGAAVRYCSPVKDGPQALDQVQGVRVYEFGPPEDVAYLRLFNPTKARETYGEAMRTEDAFYSALAALSARDANVPGVPGYGSRDAFAPFEEHNKIELGEAKTRYEFFQGHYGFTAQDSDAWRRIDDNWLDIASELALNLDNVTNNTSLVLAFELGEPGSGKVLLFAADAQVGNWLSWKELLWKVKDSANTEQTIASDNLLANVVFYKVGHHGSHNATLREAGLEKMVNNNLAAMIPVDHDSAEKKGWAMPFSSLLDRLVEKTKGRVMRIDTGIPVRANTTLSDGDWVVFDQNSEEFPSAANRDTRLYIDYFVPY
jgi:hypothetical protein